MGTFWRITWPLLAPATTVNVFLTAMGCVGEYALILVLTDGQFGTKTLGIYMFDEAFGHHERPGYGAMVAMPVRGHPGDRRRPAVRPAPKGGAAMRHTGLSRCCGPAGRNSSVS